MTDLNPRTIVTNRFKTEEDAINQLSISLGKDWRDRVIPFIQAEVTPFVATEFAEAFDISAQSGGLCCLALEKLDLLSVYFRKTNKNKFDMQSDRIKNYFLLHDLSELDKEEFVLAGELK